MEHTFIIRNVGDAPAELKKPNPSCGCMVVNVTHDTVAPASETAITVKLSPARQAGQIHRSVTIPPGNGNPEPLTLTLEGAITAPLAVVPERIILGQLEANKEVTRSAIVACALKEPVKITNVVR